QRRPSGNWFVFAASSQIATKAWGTTVGGVEIVAWRAADGGLRVAPRACPHLGADLATATVECGTLVCPWHGMRLTDRSRGAWPPFPAYGDGVLCWVRLDAVGKEEPTDAPIIPTRPPGPRLAAVARLEGVCEPCDVVANRLDPWHDAWSACPRRQAGRVARRVSSAGPGARAAGRSGRSVVDPSVRPFAPPAPDR